MVITQEAKISLQVKFLEAHGNDTIPCCTHKRKTVLVGLRSLWSFPFIWSCKVLAIFASRITKLVHRRSWRILSIMRTAWLSRQVGSSQIRRSQQEQDHCNNHPGHQNHSNTDAIVTGGPWQFLKTFCVRAIGLRLPQQVDQPPHRMFMRANTFAGIESSFCHDCPA